MSVGGGWITTLGGGLDLLTPSHQKKGEVLIVRRHDPYPSYFSRACLRAHDPVVDARRLHFFP
jgi:hypothetical protein